MKTKLKNKELTIGSWVTIGHPSIVEIMVKAGFDWLTIDMEHSSITISQAQNLIQIIDMYGCVPFVRVGENDATIIKKVMDAGAHGVIVPMVNNKQDAIRAVSAVKYPPVGTRGVGLARAQGYGLEFEKYKKWVDEESMVIVQIEHIDAVNNFEEILNVEGVDGFIVGPYDLSASMGKPGEFDSSEVREVLNQVKKMSKKIDVVSGFHVISPDSKEVIKKIKEGFKFIAFSLDVLFLGKNCRMELNKINESNNRN